MHNTNDLLHFVGSLPYDCCEDAFRNVSREVGGYLRRMPDGETGERIKWIVFQQRMLQQHAALEMDTSIPPLPVKQGDGTVIVRSSASASSRTSTRVASSSTRATIALQSQPTRCSGECATKADTAARAGSSSPCRHRWRPASCTSARMAGRDTSGHTACAPAGAGSNILAAIPHADLSIHSTCARRSAVRNYFPERDGDYKDIVFRQFARLSAAVPDDAELGFHLCYGSPGDQPLVNLVRRPCSWSS